MKFKNIFVALIVALSLSNVVVAQDAAVPQEDAAVAQETAPEGDYFGDVKFGSTKELMFNETSEFLGKSQNCYSFDKDGKMVAGTINIINDHQDLAKYIEDYNKINEAFVQMYGQADEQAVTTDDEAILNDPAKLAQAIKEGKVVASTVWKKENFTISHILSEKMTTDDMDEETKKVTVTTPICHLVLGQLNSAANAESDGAEAAAE